MSSLRRWMTGIVCASITVAWSGVAHAQLTTAVNPTDLPLPHGACPGVTNSAVPNDNMPDTDAFQCALNIIPASGGEIYVPPGEYELEDPLVVLNKSVSFRGEGQRITTLYWIAIGPGGNGIDFTSTDPATNHQLSVKSMSLLRRSGYGGTAITGTWEAPSDHRSLGGTSATIFDVHVGQYGNGSGSGADWNHCIRLTNAMGARIHVFNLHLGAFQAEPSSAIQIAGKSIGVSINDGNMGRGWYGVAVVQESQNVRIENVETSENHIGYYFATSGKYHVISNVHAGVVDRGIVVENGSDMTITDNLFYAKPDITPDNPTDNNQWPGIQIVNTTTAGEGFEVRGNFIYDFQDGITLSGPITNSRVTGNRLTSLRYGVHFKNGVTTSAIIGNSPSKPIKDECLCNVTANNP